MDDQKKLTIKEWNADDRPREKMLAKGIGALSDAELLAILISTGTKNQSALDLARAVLSAAGNNLHQLGRFTVPELTRIDGIGEAKAVTIMAALELGRRRKNADLEQQAVTSSSDAFNLMQPIVGDLTHEEFWVLLLNLGNRLIRKERVSSGGIGGTSVDVRLILKSALDNLASNLLLVHNHPSGTLSPSAEDRNLTQKVSAAAKLLDINVVDHIIIAANRFYSFADNGLM